MGLKGISGFFFAMDLNKVFHPGLHHYWSVDLNVNGFIGFFFDVDVNEVSDPSQTIIGKVLVP